MQGSGPAICNPSLCLVTRDASHVCTLLDIAVDADDHQPVTLHSYEARRELPNILRPLCDQVDLGTQIFMMYMGAGQPFEAEGALWL